MNECMSLISTLGGKDLSLVRIEATYLVLIVSDQQSRILV